MNKTRAKIKRSNKKHWVATWVSQSRPVFIFAGVLVPVLFVLGLISTKRGKCIEIFALLLAFLVLSSGVVTIAVAQVIELLRAIRRDLLTIRIRIDNEKLDDIATDLTAMRSQMGKGVLGLLGM